MNKAIVRGIGLYLLLWPSFCQSNPLPVIEIHVHVQDATTLDPIEGAFVRYVLFQTVLEDFTDSGGNLTFYIEDPTAVGEVPAAGFWVGQPYPNPGASKVTVPVASPGDKALTDLQFDLFDLLGRRVASGKVLAGVNTPLPERLADGTYLLRVRSPVGEGFFTRKLVKRGSLAEVSFTQLARVLGPEKADRRAPATFTAEVTILAEGYEDFYDPLVVVESGENWHSFGLIALAAFY